MKPSLRFATSLLCLVQAAGLVLNNGLLYSPAYAAVSATSAVAAGSESAKLDSYERTVFGETKQGQSTGDRIKALEVNLFGKTKSGSITERLTSISQALGGSGSNLLLPALAPQLDTSEVAPKSPAAAPSVAYGNDVDEAPDRAKTELHKAMELYSQGNIAQAEQSFRRVLTMDKNNGDAYYNLGVIAEGKNDLQGALRNYQAASNANPADVDFRSAMNAVQGKLSQAAEAQRREREQQEIAAKQAADEQKAQTLKQYTSSASAAFKAGNYDKAIADLQYVARQAPSDPDVQFALAQAYRGKGNLNDARTAIGRAITLSPNNQMYRTTQSQLEQQVAQAASRANSAGSPAPAPSYGRGNSDNSTAYSGSQSQSNDYASSGPGGQIVGFAPDNTKTASNDGAQITPFDDSGSNSRYPSSRGFGGGLGGLGLGGLSGGVMGYGAGGYGGGSRMRRAAIGGLSGAAMGAVMSGMMSSRGSRGKAAMKGAMIGGALGLITGSMMSRY